MLVGERPTCLKRTPALAIDEEGLGHTRRPRSPPRSRPPGSGAFGRCAGTRSMNFRAALVLVLHVDAQDDHALDHGTPARSAR